MAQPEKKQYKVVAINLGSTSTKIAYYINDQCQVSTSLSHDSDRVAACKDIWDQYEFRKSAVEAFLEDNHIPLEELDAFSSRGGHCEPVVGGTYRINDAFRAQNRSGKYGVHVGNVGVEIAWELSQKSGHAVPVVTDLPTTDEFEPLARYSGLKEIPRESRFQALNHKAMARYYAESIGKAYEDLNLVVAMLGGGISVAVHKKGMMIDGPDGLTGDGAFSNNRCGGVPTGALVKLCYSGKYTEKEMLRHINGEAGLMSYLGTTDVRALTGRAQAGDQECVEVLAAMCYQTAKDIGAYSTVLKGQVDAILLTGGMANSEYLTNLIRERVEFIAPVVILPGEREMESLCLNAYKAVSGQIELKEFQFKG